MDRKLIAVAVSSALGLPMAAHAVDVSVSGHVNRAVIIVNQDGSETDGDAQHVDANSSQTRFRFTGSGDLDNGMTAGVNLEYGLGGNVRQAHTYLSSSAGKVTLGHASTATDGVAHADKGGASWLAGVTNWCSYASMGPACPSNDGGREPVLKYDTPAIGPVSISASIGDDDNLEAKVGVTGSMGDSGYDIRVGYIDVSETLTASGAFSMGTGTSIAVGWSRSDAADTAGYADEYMYVKVDQNYGDGSIGAYYKQGEEGSADGTLWGVGVGHSLGGGATAYAGFRSIEADGAEDLSLIVAGMRVTFN